MNHPLAIIGTAGRGDDAAKLTPNHWRSMLTVAQVVLEMSRADGVVSGGAAWSDAVAVELYLQGHVKELTLHLPAPFNPYLVPAFASTQAGTTTMRYHQAFREMTGYDGLAAISEAMSRGAHTTQQTAPTGYHPFFARNELVASQAQTLFAFTFGDGPKPKDGGTADTINRFLSRRARNKEEADLNGQPSNSAGPGAAYHFCMNRKALFTL